MAILSQVRADNLEEHRNQKSNAETLPRGPGRVTYSWWVYVYPKSAGVNHMLAFLESWSKQ
jgi:hypothetical protein